MNRRTLALGAIVVAILCILPFVATSYITAFVLSLFLSIGLTYAWNLLSGYTGYLSFGQVTFFGIGSYATALMIINWQVPWLLGALISGVCVVPFAALLGAIMLRLRGPFFAIGMLGCAQISQRIVAQLPMTHGGSGLYLPPIQSIVGVYFVMGTVALGMLLLTAAIHSNSFGLRLRSIRDAEDAAEMLGVDTTRMKIAAFAIASIVPAVLGGVDAWYLSYISPPSAFNSAIDLQTVAMGVLGGLGTVWGPLIGALTLGLLGEFFWAQFPQIHLGLLGLVIALVVLYLRRGLVSVVPQLLRARRKAFAT